MFSTDPNGDSWIGGALDNPSLVLANPPSKKHKRDGGPKKGVMPAGLARYWANRFGGGMRNPPATMAKTRKVAFSGVRQGAVTVIKAGKKRAKTFESQFPVASSVVGVASGFAIKNYAAARLLPMVPASMQGPTATWVIRAATAIVPGFIVRRLMSRKFGLSMMVGGVVSLVLDLAKIYAPWLGLGAQPGLGYYAAAPMIGGQYRVGMGQYASPSLPSAYPADNPASRMLATVPTRMNPRDRF